MSHDGEVTMEDLYTIKGNPDDGMVSTVQMPRWGMALVKYKSDFVVEIDIYQDPEDTSHFTLHWVCPKCRNFSTIDSRKKQMDLRIDRVSPDGTRICRVSIEPFQCAWEMGRGTDGTKADRIDFGAGLCKLRVGVSNSIAKDA